jgi:YVTN family beta-propeller protein
MKSFRSSVPIGCLLIALTACSRNASEATQDLTLRAYVVSEQSDDLFVLDLGGDVPSAVGSLTTTVTPGQVNENHMAMVSEDATKVYVTATHADAVVVVDAASLSVIGKIDVGHHPTHGMIRPGAAELWIVNEESNSVSIIDTATDSVVATLQDPSLVVPHQVRFDHLAQLAFVSSIGGNQITVIEAPTRLVVDVLVTDGLSEGACSGDPCGYADAQIAADGMLYAAHIESGKLLVYDTLTLTRLPDRQLGPQPWIAHVELFGGLQPSHFLVPNFGDGTLSRVDSSNAQVVDVLPQGDSEVYGVNYSTLADDLAFVMNRNREVVSVIDVLTGSLVKEIDVGGTLETAGTSDDGRFILCPVSSSGDLVVIGAATLEIVATFPGVGVYPWSVATVGGQNYCH